MAVSKAQQKAVNKYMAANYDRINLTVPKGRKAVIQAYAETRGESVNGFINRAIGVATGETSAESGTHNAAQIGDIKAAHSAAGVQEPAGAILTPEALKTAQDAAQSAGETVSAFVGRAVETQAKRDKLMQAMRQREKAPDKSEV